MMFDVGDSSRRQIMMRDVGDGYYNNLRYHLRMLMTNLRHQLLLYICHQYVQLGEMERPGLNLVLIQDETAIETSYISNTSGPIMKICLVSILFS